MKIKKRYGKFGGYLEKNISLQPTLIITNEDLDYPEYYIRVDDEFFIMNKDLTGDIYIYMGWGLIALTSILFIHMLVTGYDGGMLFFTLLMYSVSAFSIYYHYTRPKKYLMLNRLESMVSIPRSLYFKPCTMAFSDVLAAWSVKNSGINPSPPRLSVFYPDGYRSTEIMGHDVVEDWSFMVWYMDKNRPLPLGSVFDEFREKDYERRKAEGFPKPLYPSNIPTPEVTPEQQAERKRIGGW